MIVEVHWIDSNLKIGWSAPGDLKADKIKTIGFLVEETEDEVVVSTSTDSNGSFVSPIAIPWECVKEYWKIEFNSN
jgi:hypothetical protein